MNWELYLEIVASIISIIALVLMRKGIKSDNKRLMNIALYMIVISNTIMIAVDVICRGQLNFVAILLVSASIVCIKILSDLDSKKNKNN